MTERFETPPGHQAQFDWSPYQVEFAGAWRRVVVYGMTLGYSRRLHYTASLDETQASIFEAIEASLWHFGGAPKELLVDNPKAFVLDAHPARFRWNPQFLELCGHYRLAPRACQVGRPQTKGKVERPFFYLEQHFVKGNAFRDLTHFSEALAAFEREDMDVRVHATTRERPLDRFEAERPHLTPLPERRFVGSRAETRKVSWDCLVAFRGSRYSVPAAYAGKLVWLLVSRGERLVVVDARRAALRRARLEPVPRGDGGRPGALRRRAPGHPTHLRRAGAGVPGPLPPPRLVPGGPPGGDPGPERGAAAAGGHGAGHALRPRRRRPGAAAGAGPPDGLAPRPARPPGGRRRGRRPRVDAARPPQRAGSLGSRPRRCGADLAVYQRLLGRPRRRERDGERAGLDGAARRPAAPPADPAPAGAPGPAERPEAATTGPADLTESAALKAQLQRLGLHTVAAHFEAEADRAAKSESSYTAYLARLVEAELADKVDRSVQARITRARFPMLRTLEQFDFAFQPGLPAARVRELATLAFLDQAANVLLVGGPGVGKTHLAIALGLRVCAARRSVLFCPAPDLLDQLVAAEAARTLGALLLQLRRLDLLVVDELGYLPMDGHRANLFFQLVATRYTRGRWSSPPTSPSRPGASSSATTCSPRPSWTACCT